MLNRKPFLITLFMLAIGIPLHGAAIDSTLYTTYTLNGGTSLGYSVCGSTLQTSGCYSSGSLGPLGKIGAMLEGPPSTNTKTNTVTRQIYVLDVANGTSGTGVALYVYRKTDTISPSFDTVVVTLTNTIVLPLTGGSNTHAYMAANAGFLIIGTDQSGVIAKVARSKFIVTSFSPFSSNISAITSNKYGYVTVAFGTSGTGSAANIILGPNGATVSDGGGVQFMLETTQATLPAALP